MEIEDKRLIILSTRNRTMNNGIIDSYASIFAQIIGVGFDHWLGDSREEDQQAGSPSYPVDSAIFGDYVFTYLNIRTVVDNYIYWLERYGTREAVRQEVIGWHEYVDKQINESKLFMTLFNWLNGEPRNIYDNSVVADPGRAANENEEDAND